MDNKSVEYLPNNPTNIGMGGSINNTVLSFGYGYGFNFLRNKKAGKTKLFDFQLHNYGRKFIFDLFIQRYKGFYSQDENENITGIYPDLEARFYSASGQYIFNNNKFSYRAAFDFSEAQLKSAGSFTVGGGIYFNEIKASEGLILKNQDRFKSYQIGTSAGYAYTWAISSKWLIAGSATTGVNLAREMKKIGGYNTKIYPSLQGRISAGYTRKDWSIGMNGIVNAILFNGSSTSTLGTMSGRYQIHFTKRFSVAPILDKAPIIEKFRSRY